MTLKDYKCIKQDNLKDCGVSCLLTIINYYNGDMSKEELLILTNTNKSGVDLFSLSMAARKIGFDTTAVKANLKDFTKEELPLISHVTIKNKYKHFIVIFEINFKKKYLIIGDPSIGVKKISFSYFESITTTYFLLLKPIKPIPKLNNSKNIKNFILDNLITYKNIYLLIIILSLFIIVFSIIITYNFKFLLDRSINYNSYYNAYIISFIILLIIILKNCAIYLKNNLVNYLDNILSFTFLNNIYKHLILLPYLYCKRHTTGDIITRINDMYSLKDSISKYIIELFINFILASIIFIIIFNINKTLSFISLISILIYLLISLIYDSILNNYIYNVEVENNKVNTHIIETFSGIDTIKNLNLENNFINNLKIKYNNFLNNNYKLFNNYNKEIMIRSFFKELLKSFNLLIGVIMVIKEKLSISDLIVFISLEDYWLDSIKSNIDYRFNFIKAKHSYNRIKDLMKVKQEQQLENKVIFNITNIKISNLSFSYNYNKKVLKNINLEINYKDKILLMGESGSGKSTLVKILLKYIDVKKNKIFFNNRDIVDLDINFIRNRICLISQKEFIFSDSLINNVIMHRDISYDDFLYLAKLTMVDEIVKDEKSGYNLLLEENGFNLSGGERQRIILLRSILKNSDIYILDESLGEVDSKKERIILKNIFKYYKEKIFIVISHRKNNFDLFNKIITLNEGIIYYE